MTTFLYSFFVLFQPGIFWPELAPYKPMIILSIVCGLSGMMRSSTYRRREVFSQSAFVYLTLFLIVQVVSVYSLGVSAMLDTFLMWYQYFFFMVVSVLLISDIKHLYRYIWGILCGGMFIVGYGIYVAYAGIGTTVGGHAAGAYGMYENHNDYTYMIIFILPFLYVFWLSEHGLKKFILFLAMIACVAGTILSLSRGGLLALLFEALLIVFLAMSKSRRLIALILVGVVAVSSVGYLWHKRDQYSGLHYTAEDAKSSRLELWKAGWNMFKDNPLLGVGSNRFADDAGDYYELSGDQYGKNAHNTYIQIIATTGIIGILMFWKFIVSMTRLLRAVRWSNFLSDLDSIRVAALISFWGLLFRATTNAKPHEWSFYLLCVIASCLLPLAKSGCIGTGMSSDIGNEPRRQETRTGVGQSDR